MCNKEYDTLYKEQHAEMDLDQARRTWSSRCSSLYDEAPYLITAYSQIGEAYRSDRWEGFVPQPDPGGVLLFQYGHANYLNLAPAGTASGTPGAEASAMTVRAVVRSSLIVFVVLVLGGIAVAVVMMLRRRTADDRE